MTVPGLCGSWDVTWTCPLPTGSEAVSGIAVQMASEVLYGLTGRQFGLCTVTLRPCRRDCHGDEWPLLIGEYGTEGDYPRPALYAGEWYNITCGSCSSGCSCTSVSEVALPGPVASVTEVRVDGVVLTKNVDYRLDDYRLLVRLGGATWPLCNDINLANTEVGTWSVTFEQGTPVPQLGTVAVGVLATEFAKALLCDDTCGLPKPVQSLTRQGVSITFLDPNEVFADRRTGLYLPDLFISTVNPHNLASRSQVYDIDDVNRRRQLGTG